MFGIWRPTLWPTLAQTPVTRSNQGGECDRTSLMAVCRTASTMDTLCSSADEDYAACADTFCCYCVKYHVPNGWRHCAL